MNTPTLITTPVLCTYSYYSDTYAGKFTASKMIFVARSSDILKEFALVMETERKNWSLFSVGPKPDIWIIDSYLPYCNTPKF